MKDVLSIFISLNKDHIKDIKLGYHSFIDFFIDFSILFHMIIALHSFRVATDNISTFALFCPVVFFFAAVAKTPDNI